MSDTIIGIIGAGDHAREVATYSDQQIAFHAVDTKFVKDELVDVSQPSQENAATPVVVALGSPLLRKQMVERWPGKDFANIIAPDTHIDPSARLGVGNQVAPHAVVMPGCQLGDHVVINVAATISHDCQLADYVTISPGVHMGGHVVIGAGAFIGIGATIKNNITIAPGVVIGAGAVLLHDADTENGVYVGAPARLINTNGGWLNEI